MRSYAGRRSHHHLVHAQADPVAASAPTGGEKTHREALLPMGRCACPATAEGLLPKGGLDLFGGDCQEWAGAAHVGLMRGHRQAPCDHRFAHVHDGRISNSRRPNSERPAVRPQPHRRVAGHQPDHPPACLSKPSPVTGWARSFVAASSSPWVCYVEPDIFGMRNGVRCLYSR
jgi:hypothetical protein